MLKSDMVGGPPQAELLRATQDLRELLQDDIFEQLGCQPADLSRASAPIMAQIDPEVSCA